MTICNLTGLRTIILVFVVILVGMILSFIPNPTLIPYAIYVCIALLLICVYFITESDTITQTKVSGVYYEGNIFVLEYPDGRVNKFHHNGSSWLYAHNEVKVTNRYDLQAIDMALERLQNNEI
jgi:hypothetical protein